MSSGTPSLPAHLLAGLTFRDEPLALDLARDNLVVCRTNGGRLALFIPQRGPGPAHAGDALADHLLLKNLALFGDEGGAAPVRAGAHELVAPGSLYDLDGEGKTEDLRWEVSGPSARIVPVRGATMALCELDALSLPPAAFVPTSPGPKFINFGSFIQGYGAEDPQSGVWRQDAGGVVYFLAPVTLPHRAFVISGELYIADFSAEAGHDISARLDRIDRARNVSEMVRLRSRGASGRQDLIHAGVLGHRVDNHSEAFHIHVTWQYPATPHQQDLRLYGARVVFLPRALNQLA